jgi:uncharacterized protein (DUF885 family)
VPFFLSPFFVQGPHTELPQLVAYMKFEGVGDYEKYVARLEAIPASLAQVQELLKEGIAASVLPPHVGLEGVSAQLASAVSGLDGDGRQSPMWRPCPRTGGGGSQHKEGTLEAAASALLVGPVKAAWQALKAFVDETYLPAVASGRSGSVACADLPNGKAW